MNKKYITLENLSEWTGKEIIDFKLDPLYQDGICIGLDVKCKQKSVVEFISVTISNGAETL